MGIFDEFKEMIPSSTKMFSDIDVSKMLPMIEVTYIVKKKYDFIIPEGKSLISGKL